MTAIAQSERPATLRSSARRSGDGLALRKLTKRFDAVQALDGCTFAVPRGSVLGFLGPNGAGKTTTMRAIFGLVQVDAGEILWDGRPVGFEERLRFGYMPEERGLYPRMRVAEQLEYFSRLHGHGARAARQAARIWLERLDLAARAGSRVEELSHGNQQRAQLAAALVHQPDLLVLDEPFAGLDPLAIQTLAGVLRGEAARGAAVVFSSHQLELVEDLCEEVAIIDHGRIVATGDVDALKRRSQRRLIELQLESGSTWLPDIAGVEIVGGRNGHVRLRVTHDVDPARVLVDAQRHADVIGFSYGPPSLTELFVELVER